jgi:hypothetical protein
MSRGQRSERLKKLATLCTRQSKWVCKWKSLRARLQFHAFWKVDNYRLRRLLIFFPLPHLTLLSRPVFLAALQLLVSNTLNTDFPRTSAMLPRSLAHQQNG